MPHRLALSLLLAPVLVSHPALAANSPRLEFEKLQPTKADEAVTSGADRDDDAAPQTSLDRARTLGLSDDEVRPGKSNEATLFGKPLIIGGEFSTSLRGRKAYDLEPGAADDDLRFDAEIKLNAIWLPSDTSVIFASGRAIGELDLAREGGNGRRAGGLTLDNLWWLKTNLGGTPLALQIGRQRLRERREFWWDDNIDGARLHYFGKKVTAFVGVGKPVAHFSTLGRMDPADKGLLRFVGNAAWEWNKRQYFEVFGLHQKDQSGRYEIGQIVSRTAIDDADADLTWLGVRARGCFKPGLVRRLCYWGDLAQVRGTELRYDLDGLNATQNIVDQIDRVRVRGWSYDVGINLELPLKFRPVLTVARARGSGDKPGTPGVDGAFRQTGLHSNDAKYRGLARFRSYGEVLRPDLSNIRVTTLALGVPLGKTTWIETLWHQYRQPFADNRIMASPIGENPDGISPKLGNEFDISLSHRPPTGWKYELTAGAFRAGTAFGPEAGRWAGLIEAKVEYVF